ncbi:MAG: uridine kinase [Blastocatellia bacterium]|nr:uridine kinase [Blastocatellia bacterium]MCS7157360.1 uridine kinase [Blastocatellia bacterium]MCX7753226.1 uridine kinase [Blastocatellia bacterium]MDW8168265.1 uridine kinase [Acidobacteriota bacterium]MDW8255442.1 uridine kinase [Acidobacteriota bacterium]
MRDVQARRVLIIGICGGTGSGKTTVAQKILEAVGADRVVYLQQDAYYKDLSHLPLEERHRLNFDHPDAIDTDLLLQHIEELRAGRAIEQPIYDFTTHTRRPETRRIEPRPIILVEGILVFENPRLRALMDLKIFVDTADDIRFIRRLLRDISERGRTVESVIRQYLETVRPMHLEFVEPSKRYADIIIPEGGYNIVGIDLIIEKIKAYLSEVERSGETTR